MEKRRIESSLVKKGFDLINDGDHRRFFHKYDGKDSGVRTKISRGSAKYKTLGPELIKSMQKQLKLDTVRQFRELVDCTLSGDEYNTILKSKGFIPHKR